MESSEPGTGSGNSAIQRSQFLKLPKVDQTLILDKLDSDCDGDADLIHPWMARTAIASIVGPGSAISGESLDFEDRETQEVILIPFRPAPFKQFEEIPISVEFLKSEIRSRHQPLAQQAA